MDLCRMIYGDSVSEMSIDFDRSTTEGLTKMWEKILVNVIRTEGPLYIAISPIDEEEAVD